MAKRQGRRKRGVAAWEWVRVRRAEVTASQACLPRIADWGTPSHRKLKASKRSRRWKAQVRRRRTFNLQRRTSQRNPESNWRVMGKTRRQRVGSSSARPILQRVVPHVAICAIVAQRGAAAALSQTVTNRLR